MIGRHVSQAEDPMPQEPASGEVRCFSLRLSSNHRDPHAGKWTKPPPVSQPTRSVGLSCSGIPVLADAQSADYAHSSNIVHFTVSSHCCQVGIGIRTGWLGTDRDKG